MSPYSLRVATRDSRKAIKNAEKHEIVAQIVGEQLPYFTVGRKLSGLYAYEGIIQREAV